jgi:hypothetical protein
MKYYNEKHDSVAKYGRFAGATYLESARAFSIRLFWLDSSWFRRKRAHQVSDVGVSD